MTDEQMRLMADALEGQAMLVVMQNTYPISNEPDSNYAPDLEAAPAHHAADLFAVAAGLRAMLGRL